MATIKSKEQIAQENARLKQAIEKKHGKTTEQLCTEREKRVIDAIELRVPDRVPVTINPGIFAARYAGLPASAMYYDHAAYREACKKTVLDFEPDTGATMGVINSGLVMEIMDAKHQKWPGGNLPDDAPYQFVEGEYMMADEYDVFLSDPSDFVFRQYLPRIYGTLAPLSKLPPFRTMVGGQGFTALLGIFTRPEFKELAAKIQKAAGTQQELAREVADFNREMEGLGFPAQLGGGGAGMGAGIMSAPFDTISDYLRGMRGTMLDMYRCPDKLLLLCDKILEWRIGQAGPAVKNVRGVPPRQGMPLHRGSDGFMSIKQFETFYWPTLKKAILHNVELGYIVAPFWEGVWDGRLDYLLDFPKGKIVFWCEKTDVFKAKEIIGNTMCIQGGVPPTLLEVGTPQEVTEHCQKLIKIVGKGGGFILSPGSAIDCAKPANMKAMMDAVKKYGGY